MSLVTYSRDFKDIDGLRNATFFCRLCLFLLLLLLLPNQAKAQSPDVTVEEIQFESKGVTLSGTIYMPRHPYAAVVLVHGSGQTPRMSSFAQLLAENGISVFTYDKRGVGQSGGIYAGPEVGTNNVDQDNLTLLAEDASVAINILRQREKNIPIGLVGFSQAGWIIPLTANKNSQVNFMVLFSGAVISTLDQLIFQHWTDGKSDFWDDHTETQVREYMSKAREHVLSNPTEYRLNKFINTDPREALSTLSIPGLWLFGEKDIQIPIGISKEIINTLKAQGKPYEYCLFSTLDHFVSGSKEPVDIAIHWIKNR